MRFATIGSMGGYTFPAFNKSTAPRYVVVWNLHWYTLNCQRLEAVEGLAGAMAAVAERLAGERWQAEATPEYGFTLIRRELSGAC